MFLHVFDHRNKHLQAYFILDEFIMAGEVQETSLKVVLKHIYDQNALEKSEVRRV